MKASDYIVEFLIDNEITDVFGYPGGMVTHLMDSFSKYKERILAHLSYNEQGAALAACGYAQTSGKIGVAYATSGPGATNLLTGICNAYMDSIPTVFITGQVNSFEQKGELTVRQRGFQETDIVSIVEPITKCALRVDTKEKLQKSLEQAFFLANEERKGPVLLDISMDVMRADIEPSLLPMYKLPEKRKQGLSLKQIEEVKDVINHSKRPVVLVGNGLKRDKSIFKRINDCSIPVVSSMLAVDVQTEIDNYYGFIGAYGNRTANFIVAKSDLVISLGARLDVRQVGTARENFAPCSQIVRVDIDTGELEYKVHQNEISFGIDASVFVEQAFPGECMGRYDKWNEVCRLLQKRLEGIDDKEPNELMMSLSDFVDEDTVITTDVGQNQVWAAQSFILKKNQRLLFSGGHGVMGYSLPAAIGAYYAKHQKIYSLNGDGGIQMNIQELQWIAREHLPIVVIVFNNNALGMIRHFQEMYFSGNYYQTVSGQGFDSPNFELLAYAYRLKYLKIESAEDFRKMACLGNGPAIVEVILRGDTYVYPKLEYGKPNQDQEPLLDRKLYDELMQLGEDK